MKLYYRIFSLLIPILLLFSNESFSQKYDEVFKNVNLNLELNYDSTFVLEHDYSEMIFDKKSIFRNVDILGYSYEFGRFDPFKKGSRMDIQSYYKYASIFDTNTELYFRDLGQYSIRSVPNRRTGNDFKELRSSLWTGQVLKFIPNERPNYKLQIVQDDESIKDTTFNEIQCYRLRRTLRYSYSNNKAIEWGKYSIFIVSDLFVNKDDFAIIHKKRLQELKNDVNNQSFKSETFESFVKVGTHYYRSNSYFLMPRHQPNHIVDYNDKGLYTLIIKKSKLVAGSLDTGKFKELPFAPYDVFCLKADSLNENIGLKYEEVKKNLSTINPR